MVPIILFRKSSETEEEYKVAELYFPITEQRTECSLDLVIGRYSVLPFYKELENDLKNQDCKLINSYEQYSWIANYDYYYDLESHLPKSWFDHNFHQAPEKAYVVKGRTNSRKFQWNKYMYAENKKQALIIASELANDGLIGPQGIVYKEYVPLQTFSIGINGLPLTNEWRFFYYKDQLLSYGYYWTIAEKVLNNDQLPQQVISYANTVAKKAAQYVNFFVLDIAFTADHGYTLIEINDGCMSGLSNNDPATLYGNLRKALKNEN